jgi:hypothetical protein
MDLLQLILHIITKQFNLTEDEAKGLIYDGDKIKADAADTILNKAAEKVTKLKQDATDNFNKGHQKATQELMPKVEKTFKDITGFTTEATDFEDLIKKYKEEVTKKKATDLKDDDVKRHPLYIALETERVPKTEFETLKGEYEGYKKNVVREQVLGKVREKAWAIVAPKVIESANKAVADTRRQDFLSKFGQFDFDEQEGKVIVLKEGKRLEDAHGNVKPFETFVTEVAQLNYEFKGQSDKGQTGNEGDETVVITETPKTEKELNAVYNKYASNSETDIKTRIAALDYYEKNRAD